MNRMKKLTLASTILGTLIFASASLRAEMDVLNSETGIVQVFVQNEDGAAIPGAPVYVTDGQHVQYMEASEMGTVSFTLQEGKYTISSAITKPMPDCIDRYASPNAMIRVIPQDTTSLILTLRLVNDPISDLSVSTLKKIGVADEVAKYNN